MDNLTILTSVIGASAATIGVVVTKDSKISEFRQQWIDALRQDVAQYCAVSIALYRSNVKWTAKAEIGGELKSSDDLVQEANMLLFRIKLRLDPKKDLSQELIASMQKLVSLCTYAQEMSTVTDDASQAVLDDAQAVLEEAWVKVRKGEWRFRAAFATALTALTGSLGLLSWHWYRSGHSF